MMDYRNAEAVRKPAGHVLIDGQQVADTIQCVHCGMHWVMLRGVEATLPRYCSKCDGLVCPNKPECTECVPAEKRLELREAMVKDRAA